MDRREQTRYTEYYTQGSAARQMESAQRPPRPARRVRRHRQPREIRVPVDFMALTGMLVAAVLLVLMVVEFVHLARVNQQVFQARERVEQLELEHQRLDRIYRAGYDLDEILQDALDMGMIPAGEAQTVILPRNGR